MENKKNNTNRSESDNNSSNDNEDRGLRILCSGIMEDGKLHTSWDSIRALQDGYVEFCMTLNIPY